jgi:hypothetical protein
MPLSLKYGLDCVIHSAPFAKTLFFFSIYGLANLSTTYFDGKKSILNSRVVQTAWYKIALKAYNKLLELDWLVN